MPLEVPIHGTKTTLDAIDADLVGPESYDWPAPLVGSKYGSGLVVGLPLP